jgi:single-strand DNA-binding protein
LDKATNEWIDVDTSWWRCTAFDQLAENICENLSKGEAVIGYGNASQDDWEDKEGGKRTNLKFIVNNLGADQRWRKRQVSGKDYQGEAPF